VFSLLNYFGSYFKRSKYFLTTNCKSSKQTDRHQTIEAPWQIYCYSQNWPLRIPMKFEGGEGGREGREKNAPLSARSLFIVLYFSCFKFELMSVKECHRLLLAASIEFSLSAASPTVSSKNSWKWWKNETGRENKTSTRRRERKSGDALGTLTLTLTLKE